MTASSTGGDGLPGDVLDEWPAVARRIVGRLRRLGADRSTAEDLASEAITRALAHEIAFESRDHLFNWAMLVTRNLWFDQCRAAARAPELCAIDDHDVATYDTATVAEHRMQLRRVLDALGRMSAEDRLAVLAETVPGDRREAVRLNVRRHRARARLRAALAAFAGLLTLRRLSRAALVATPVALVTVATLCLRIPDQPDATTTAEAPAAAAPIEPVARPIRVAAQAVDRALEAPAARATATRPSPPVRARRQQKVVDTAMAGGRLKAHAYVEDNRPEEHLICVSTPVMPEFCYGRPIV
jgi:DNA-directed RNA polymerase specialized sigma24 family protein